MLAIISKLNNENLNSSTGFFVKFDKFVNSIRFRIMAAILIMGILPMLVMEHTMMNTYRQSIIKNSVIDIQSNLSQIAYKIGPNLQYIDEKTNVFSSELDMLSDVYEGRIIVVNGQMKIVYDSYVFEEGKTLISESVINVLSGRNGANFYTVDGITEVVMPIHGFENALIGVILVDVNESEFLINIRDTYEELFVVRILLFMSILVVAFVLSGLLIKPIETLTSLIRRFEEGYNNERVPSGGYTEVGELGDEFNKLFGKMSQLDKSRQEFVSNVSHELKTPITSIKVLADSLNGQEDVPIKLYKEFMTDIANEIDRENKIINDLLTLVRMDKTEAGLIVTTANINELVESVLKRLSPIATRENIEITFESFRSVVADVDEVKLSLAITNLVENAIKYNKKDGWIKVSLNADHKYFYVQVEDSGIGIPKEQIGKIFDRFYRVDKTRSRETGGTGLGLSITRNAILMHNGQIKVESHENKGSKFIMRIPLSQSKEA